LRKERIFFVPAVVAGREVSGTSSGTVPDTVPQKTAEVTDPAR
jgi:hypothetical protein